MGAVDFADSVKVGDRGVGDAFAECRDQALWDHGHSGYSGTIAEKPGYEFFNFPDRLTASDIYRGINESIDYYDPTTRKIVPGKRPEWAGEVKPSWEHLIAVYNDKWGDAVAFRVGDVFHFTGIASC